MNKISFIKTGMILLIAITLFACSKEERIENVSDNDRLISASPYEIVGKKHNEWLHFSMKNVKSTEEYYDKVLPLIKHDLNVNKLPNEFMETVKVMTCNLNDKSVIDLLQETADSLLLNGYISESVHEKCMQIDSIIKIDTALPLNEKILLIENIEIYVLNNNALTEEDKEIILSTTATAKYSMQYWEGYTTKEGPGWYILTGDVTGALLGSLVGWEGAVIGAVVGSFAMVLAIEDIK